MFWRKVVRAGGAGTPRDVRVEDDPTDIRADLERRGVSAEISGRVALRLGRRIGSAQTESYDLMIDGVAEALRVQARDAAISGQGEPDLAEIERLMAAFMGELSKLDEVLDVLTAHVERMRSRSIVPEHDTLH